MIPVTLSIVHHAWRLLKASPVLDSPNTIPRFSLSLPTATWRRLWRTWYSHPELVEPRYPSTKNWRRNAQHRLCAPPGKQNSGSGPFINDVTLIWNFLTPLQSVTLMLMFNLVSYLASQKYSPLLAWRHLWTLLNNTTLFWIIVDTHKLLHKVSSMILFF